MCYSVIFGGAVGKFLLTGFKKYKNTGKPLISYDIAVLLIPSMLIGTLIGVYLKKMFPDIFLLILLCILLTFATKKIYKRACLIKE